MSQQLINRSTDLTRLREEGYAIEVRGGHLIARHIPYLNAERLVQYGALITVLDNDGACATAPTDHTIMFTGTMPCTSAGAPLNAIHCGSNRQVIAPDLVIQHRFSSKPPMTGRYPDYYEKISTYANQLSSHAEAIDPAATPRPHLPVAADPEENSVFRYMDTASARCGISAISAKLELSRVAIVGLGGTGSYVLDQVAKTPVREIHLFDGDVFSSHNAFRSPGAASLQELEARPAKVAYFAAKYDPFRSGIIPHFHYVSAENAADLQGMDFAFLCLDGTPEKRLIVEALEGFGVAFVDVGMGLHQQDGAVLGQLRVTASTPQAPALQRIPFTSADVDDAYNTNIQVADLNALNAALAVIRWKKHFGFYVDLEGESSSVYAVDGNQLVNI